jgi:hypothetical protein
MAYEWRKNIACVAVYKTLERDDRMDQFESIFIPFENAGEMEAGDLAFFPNAGSSSVRKRAAKHFTAKFLKYVFDDYDVKKERPAETLQKLFKSVVKILSKENNTLVDLAETMDSAIKFEDE